MIRLSQISLKVPHSHEALEKKLTRLFPDGKEDILSWEIVRKSVDARKKPDIFYVYTIEIQGKREAQMLKWLKKQERLFKLHQPRQITTAFYRYPKVTSWRSVHAPVVVGSGPAGLFATYVLAKAGCKPILIERGAPVEKRQKDVEQFWRDGVLKPDSNVQFGEGGAGTFSDGKLNTGVRDVGERGKEILRTFVRFGAPEEILYDSRPHVGTDYLCQVVSQMRRAILDMGGQVWFHTCMKEIKLTQRGGERRLTGILVETPAGEEVILTEHVVLAIGHSARDTFFQLQSQGVPMEAKAFAVGVRIEHPQSLIDLWQYGRKREGLPPAPYKLTASLENGRGVYSFCMCPGGYVVDASSEQGYLAVNGMSYQKRLGENANSAVIVTVSPADYRPFAGEEIPAALSGVAFQRELEKRAYLACGGKIPLQRYEDFCHNRKSVELGEILPQSKGKTELANVRELFPQEIAISLQEGIFAMGRKIKGFDGKDVLLSGVETRTSSPVRIKRDTDTGQSTILGLYPCGEGAGYAGGIMSAAMDGMKTAEKLCRENGER